MTHKEILEKAIQKAIDGGWHFFSDASAKHDFQVMVSTSYKNDLIVKALIDGEYRPYACQSEIIYDYDFAKALWAEKANFAQMKKYSTRYPSIDPVQLANFTPWKHHLRQMVIADDPIKYLGNHIND